jgi:hypothetical protein
MIDSKLTRRRFLQTAVAASATLSIGARPNALRDRLMVQGQPQNSGSAYNHPNIMRALDALGGLRLMRCRIPYSNTIGWKTYSALAQSGVRFCFTLTTRDILTTVNDLIAFQKLHPTAIWAIELPNEPDLNPVSFGGLSDKRLGVRSGDAPALIAFCQQVHNALKAHPGLAAVPILGFNDWMTKQQAPFTDLANSHIYPKPNESLDPIVLRWRALVAASGHSQGVISEWGRTTGGDSRNVTAPPLSLEDQGTRLERDVQTMLNEPTVRALSLFELFSWGDNREINNFGLFNSDLTKRPVVDKIRSIIT